MGRMGWYLRASTFGSPSHAEQGPLSSLVRPGSENNLCVYALTRALGHSEVFCPLTEVQQIVETWQGDSSESRPPKAFGKKTPNEFADEIAPRGDLVGLQTAGNLPWSCCKEKPIWSM